MNSHAFHKSQVLELSGLLDQTKVDPILSVPFRDRLAAAEKKLAEASGGAPVKAPLEPPPDGRPLSRRRRPGFGRN